MSEPAPEPVAPETPAEPAEPAETPEPVEEPAGPEEPGESPTEAPAEEPAPPEASLSQKDMEKALDALEREATRHANRVSEIMGEDAQALVPCPLCSPNIPGFRFDVAPSDEALPAIRAAIGLPTIEKLKASPFARKCDICDGSGKVLSGSLVLKHETLSCPPCKGRGWVAVGPEHEAGPVAAASNGEPPALAAVPDDGIERDMFGTPETDEDYGKMPNMRKRPVEYWQTLAT